MAHVTSHRTSRPGFSGAECHYFEVVTPWKILVLASRDSDLKPFRNALVCSGREVEFKVVRTAAEVVAELERASWHAVVLTAHVSQLHLSNTLAAVHGHDPLLPVVLVCRSSEASLLVSAVKTGIAGIVFTEVIDLLMPMLEREIHRHAECRAQHRREKRMQWLAESMEVAPVGLAIADRHGVIHWANTQYRELAGCTLEEVQRGAATLWAGGEEFWTELNDAVHNGRQWRGSVPAPEKGGTMAVHQVVVGQLEQATGEPWYVVMRQAGAAAVAEGAELYTLAQRTELFAAIAGGIAHDLNNILAPITMAANILGEQDLAEENVELVRTIEHSSERGAAVIRQVLTFAHGSDNCEMELQPRFVLREVARLAAEVFPPCIGVHCELPPALWPIVGDPAEIQQALVNVLLNARDAVPEGGHITISAWNRMLQNVPRSSIFTPEPGEFVEIAVEDDGPGVEREVAERIWEPFVTTKGAGQAAGLGLSRVAGVLRSHGGFGLMRNRPSGGTKLSLFFPRAVGAGEAIKVEEPTVAPERGRILVVDDEETILQLSRRILEKAGYEVMVASEGREALGVFARHRAEIGLVLTDLAMPGMNGFTLLWALRRSKPDLRVMVATGQGSEANLRELEKMGVREVLLKPFSARRLLDAVARTLAEPVQCEPDLFLGEVFANEA